MSFTCWRTCSQSITRTKIEVVLIHSTKLGTEVQRSKAEFSPSELLAVRQPGMQSTHRMSERFIYSNTHTIIDTLYTAQHHNTHEICKGTAEKIIAIKNKYVSFMWENLSMLCRALWNVKMCFSFSLLSRVYILTPEKQRLNNELSCFFHEYIKFKITPK